MSNTTSVRDRRGTETANPEKRNPAADAASVGGKRGIDLLHDPVLNKATAYTEAEREALGLVGLVPDATESEDLQLHRVLQQLDQKTTDLERYIYLVLKQAKIPRPLGLPSPCGRGRTIPMVPPVEQAPRSVSSGWYGTHSFLRTGSRRRGGSEHPDSDFRKAFVNTATRPPGGRRSADAGSSPTADRSASVLCGGFGRAAARRHSRTS